MLALIEAMRPREWVKNLVVLGPLLFSGRATEGATLVSAGWVFAAFCAASSAGYLVNDVRDVELDRAHSIKRGRPIPSGRLGRTTAIVAAPALVAAGLTAAWWLDAKVGAIVTGYVILTLAYSFVLKSVVILDVMGIASGFLLRVLGGASAVDAAASRWLIVCTGMAALFLGFTKRRQEAFAELESGQRTRPVLEHYSLPFLDQMVALVTAATVLAYVIYATESPLVGERMLLTVPPVVYGTFRYLYLIYDRKETRDAATLVRTDPGIVLAVIAWALSVLIVLYL